MSLNKSTLILASILLIGIYTNPFALTKIESKAINSLLHSKQVEKRKTAASSLKYADNKEAAHGLAQALIHDQDSKVRVAAAGALWGHSHAEQVQAALWQATEDEPEIAVRAAGALKSLGVPVTALADTFRKGLQANGSASQFNAARGLIGVDNAYSLLPYLLDYLQVQSHKNNQSGIKAATDALFKLSPLATTDIKSELLNEMNHDQAGNHLVLSLLAEQDPATNVIIAAIDAVSQSQFELNRIAAANLTSKLNVNNNPELDQIVTRLFSDKAHAVVEAITMSCGQGSYLIAVCSKHLSQQLNSEHTAHRKNAADALANQQNPAKNTSFSNKLNDQLRDRALNDVSDDVRYDAIDAYINSDNTDAMKANLLVAVALNESQAYIITFALSRLNRFNQYLDSEQKQKLTALRTHADAEVRRIIELIL